MSNMLTPRSSTMSNLSTARNLITDSRSLNVQMPSLDVNSNSQLEPTLPLALNQLEPLPKPPLPGHKLRQKIARTLKKRKAKPKAVVFSRSKLSNHIYPLTIQALGLPKSKYKKLQIYEKFKGKAKAKDVALELHKLHLKEFKIKKPHKSSKALVKQLRSSLEKGQLGNGYELDDYVKAFKNIYPVVSTVLKVTQPELTPFLIAGDVATEFI